MSRRLKKKNPAARARAPVSPTGEIPGGADCRPPESECRPSGLNDRWTIPGVCIFLAAVVWVVFGQTLRHDFVNYDDDVYVYENPEVTQGLTLRGIVWAVSHFYAGNWHPLTWISHMLDCQWYGLHPGGHHLTSVLLHTATAILLFLVLRRMTGALWRSAFVAAVFAIHPLRVESVAWVAERKDVLSGVFFMLTIGAYVRYAQGVRGGTWQVTRTQAAAAPGLSRVTRHATLFYGLVLMFFALGLMCKPMLVTLPCVLLLLDYWPLGRMADGGWRKMRSGEPVPQRSTLNHLLYEKLPLFGLAAAACGVTLFAQTVALSSFEQISFPLRVGNALNSCVSYVDQMFWPSGLAVFYPFPAKGIGVARVVLSLVLLAGISTGVFVLRRHRPYLMTGWLWYLIMLVPVIGIIQAGTQARADRYTYLPQIGLYVLLTWAVADLCAGWRHRRVVLGGGSTIVLLALMICARGQTSYWRNSELLWTHALACTPDNFIGQNNLGGALLKKGSVGEAIFHFQKALEIEPDSAEAYNNLGSALLQKGNVDEAIYHFQKALQINPDFAEAHNNLGNALLQKGNVDEAIAHFQKGLQINPDFAKAHYNLGNALLQKGNVDEAIIQFQRALQINPDYAEAHNNLGNALLRKGNVDEAIIQFQRALQINPDYADACYNLGDTLLQKGKVEEAIEHFRKALQINPGYVKACYNLGNALLQKGKVDEAIAYFQKALQINPGYAKAHNNLGNALLQKGKVDEAIAHFQRALQITPDSAETQNNLAWVLATCPQASLRNGGEAVELAQRANQLTGDGNPVVLGTLAAAYAEAGRFPEATETAQRAWQLARTQSNTALADNLQSQLKLYQAGLAFHLH
jgi:protein O-mannosyl-transferase